MKFLSVDAWEQFIARHPYSHILQTPAWGELKAAFNWTPKYVTQGALGALILFRRLPLGFSVAYLPRGPIGEGEWAPFWSALDDLCKKERALFLRVEPDIWEPASKGFIQRQLPQFIETNHTIQPPRTILIDLRPSEDEILMAMKSKTRYNIRLAERKEVIVRPSADVEAFYRMMQTTGERDAFGIHNQRYYQRAYDLFKRRDACTILIAAYEDEPLAGLMAFSHGETAWYFYGASTDEERNRMPTYLLQWEAIRWAKNRGCKTYDLWGIPDHPEATLEESFLERSDDLWGVYRFKRGFGGEICRTIGAWDRVYHPHLYKLYQVYAGRKPSTGA